MEYDVVWGEGSLGLTLRPDLGEDMPPVVGRITKDDSAAARANVAIGHMLISINGEDTARKGYDVTVGLLQSIVRPATLRFRVPIGGGPGSSSRYSTTSSTSSSTSASGKSSSHRSSSKSEYTILWGDGPLGMILRPDDEDCHIPCIRKLTGKGTSAGMENARIGDILIAINGQDTKCIGFRSTISLLKTMRKPAYLKFRRMRRRLSRRRSDNEHSSNSVSSKPLSLHEEYGVYDIVWREGQLGLKLKPGHRDTPVVSRLTGEGTASGLHNATVGDELVSVNGKNVLQESYQSTLRMLKHSEKPAILRFRPVADSHQSRMSVASAHSHRSAPSTYKSSNSMDLQMDEDSIMRRHKVAGSSSHRSRSRDRHKKRGSSSINSTSRRRRKKEKIPLDVAKQIVCSEQNLDPKSGEFAGVLISSIVDNSKESSLLRMQAKAYIIVKAEAYKNKQSEDNAEEALTRAEREALVLEEALMKVREEAFRYEKLLAEQARQAKILKPATKNKSVEVIGKQNNVIAELSGVISGFKREEYSDEESQAVEVEETEEVEVNESAETTELRNSMINDLHGITANNECAQCGSITSDIEQDSDGKWYCLSCWEEFLDDNNTAKDDLVGIPNFARLSTQEIANSIDKEDDDEREEEQRAILEAESKLRELKERKNEMLLMSDNVVSHNSHNSSRMSEAERRQGEEELMRALKEEEEKARKMGKESLANALAIQQTRRSSSSSLNLPPPPTSSSSTDTTSSPIVAPPIASVEGSHPAVTPTPRKSEEEEEEDQTEALFLAQEKNLALAKQLEEAQEVVQRARASFIIGDENGDASLAAAAAAEAAVSISEDEADLSAEQIRLFKKLTSFSDERQSAVDRMHPVDDEASSSEEDEDGVWI